jgi:(1->4)-alpha-D-glucan 1-alpha-D-glucosylmutase
VPFARRVARAGAVNSLAQLALKLTAPGVPDLYQGNELWDLHLVDPDNRRPVDVATRQGILESFKEAMDLADGSEPPADGLLRGFVNDLLAAWPDGRIKLWLTARLLRLREREPRLVLDGNYVPLIVDGARSARVVAFARRYEDRVLITIVPRLVAGMVHAEQGWPITDAVWQDTVVRLPGNLATARLRNAITGDVASIVAADGAPTVAVGEVLRNCPVAVLISG